MLDLKAVKKRTNSKKLLFLLQIYLDPNLVSAQFSYMLLESNRVCYRNENETNFHIFHLLASIKNDVYKRLNISANMQYLLDCNGRDNSKIADDSLLDSLAMEKSFSILEIVGEDREKIFNILGAILHLGNIIFFEENDNNIGNEN